MDSWLWTVGPYLALFTSVLVPLGILVHYWRRADSLPLPADAEIGHGYPRPRAVQRYVQIGRVASVVAFAAAGLSTLRVWVPNRTSDSWDSFLMPLAVVSVGIVVLFVTPTGARRKLFGLVKAIDLTPRSVWSFGRASWFGSWTLGAALLTATVCLAGLASSTDSEGRFAVLSVAVGNAASSSTFLGWYYGVPILIGLAVLTAVTFIAIWVIARPTLAWTVDGRAVDVWLRRLRTRTVLSLSGGAVVLTLAWSLLCIGSGAAMRLEIPGGNLGSIAVGTPVAALVVPFNIAGLVLQGLGLALLVLPLFTKTPRTTARRERGSSSGETGVPAAASLV